MSARCPAFDQYWTGEVWVLVPCRRPPGSMVVYDDGALELMCEVHATAGTLEFPFFEEESADDDGQAQSNG